MSEHFAKKGHPPPGISSFTKIRLGWIGPEKVLLVKPEETAMAFLSPLSQNGDKLVIKIPLSSDRYYLIENRQPFGFDQNLPDSGILVLKVNTGVEEGSGTVKVMDADHDARHFMHATFRIDEGKRNLYIDSDYEVAVLPLWTDNGKTGVLVTTPEKSSEARDAAAMIYKLLGRYTDTSESGKNKILEECIAAFKKSAFKDCIQMARKALAN